MNQINNKLHVWPFLFQLKLQNIRTWRNWTGFWAGKVSFLLFFHFCLLLKHFALAPIFCVSIEGRNRWKGPLGKYVEGFSKYALGLSY